MAWRICPGCKDAHDPLLNCNQWRRMKEYAASNEMPSASNTASNEITPASNAVDQVEVTEKAGDRKQRWDRESYNAYQREWMRKYRERKRGL